MTGGVRGGRRFFVSRRALTLGATAGVLQAAVNQGDLWVRNLTTGAPLDATLVTKTLLSPLVSIGLCVVSAALEHVGRKESGL